MNEPHYLSDLAPGQRGTVRALDIGLAPGTEVECLGCSPAGDPSAYLIRGAVIAIRASDGHDVLLRSR